ncbi:MAG: hypothetical protein KGJ02_04330 [Verrucomicrobiota bacterium]|nr:hypothetical protein [Verrucomicrobiota bacterium]
MATFTETAITAVRIYSFKSNDPNQPYQKKFKYNHNPASGFIGIPAEILASGKSDAELAKGILTTSNLLQAIDKQSPFLSLPAKAGLGHASSVAGHAYGFLTLPYGFAVAKKVRDGIQGDKDKKINGWALSRDVTELGSVSCFSVAGWIPGKELSTPLLNAGKVLSIWPHTYDLGKGIKNLKELKSLKGRVTAEYENVTTDETRDVSRAVDKTITQTWLKVGKLVLSLLTTLAFMFTLITGIAMPVVVSIALLVATLTAVTLNLMAERIAVSERLLVDLK